MRLVRKIDKNIPVYIVTAFQNDYLEELKSIRDDGIEFQILTKPIEKDHLLQVLDGVILQKLSESDSVVKLRLYVATKTKRINKAINNLHEFFPYFQKLNSLSHAHALELCKKSPLENK